MSTTTRLSGTPARVLTAAAAVISTALLGATPAHAAPRLVVAGSGTSATTPTSVILTGEASGSPIGGAYTGTVDVPGGVPPLGECSPAHATLRLTGEDGTLTLASDGEVCSVLTAWVVHRFQGRFTVEETSKRALRRTVGHVDLRAVGGVSEIYATS